MRDTEALGAGDPGALAALWDRPDQGARRGLAEAWRRLGFLAADLDPLRLGARSLPAELDAAGWGLGDEDAADLRRAYGGTLGWEIGHVLSAERRDWLAAMAEADWQPDADSRQRALDLIAKGEVLEAACDRRMPGAKTFGLSGAEGYLALLGAVLDHAAAAGARRAVVGGMHRGRLTQMALVFGKPLVQLLAEAQGRAPVPEGVGLTSDSPYHLGWEGEVETPAGPLGIWVAPHPSHLSVVVPVAQGLARAMQDRGEPVFPLALHTDAAFAGQGVNAEVMQLAGLAPFTVGGTVHLVLNNQVGFTTGAEAARTARSATDIARLTEAPVLHVNGHDPDAAIRAAGVAVAWRARFGSDIVVNLIAYRRKGHNEIDEPRFTQPRMYAVIDAQPRLSGIYAGQTGLTADTGPFSAGLDRDFAAAPDWRGNMGQPAGVVGAGAEATLLRPVGTGLGGERLRALGARLTTLPETIQPHRKVAEFLAARRTAIADGRIDWATAEALALASLAEDGTRLRLGGQDSVRGAFTQRHLRVHCQQTGAVHDVLSGLAQPPQIHDTPLTEEAVLAFEYGWSLDGGLPIWEAQFGDFLNVAQAIFDQFIVCGEVRWQFASNLVLLLPHGIDGGGPDHATAHPERLLAACAEGNMQLVNLSTPANLFHALRRQVLAPWRKPLVVLAPKTLLRHPACRSDLAAFAGRFRPVIGDDRPARRVVMSTGKLAVLLAEARGARDVALIRLEQLYPLDAAAIADALEPYGDAELIWAQEEPANMGCFGWLDRRLEDICGRRWRLVTRPASPSPSAGPKSWDDANLKAVIAEALDG